MCLVWTHFFDSRSFKLSQRKIKNNHLFQAYRWLFAIMINEVSKFKATK